LTALVGLVREKEAQMEQLKSAATVAWDTLGATRRNAHTSVLEDMLFDIKRVRPYHA